MYWDWNGLEKEKMSSECLFCRQRCLVDAEVRGEWPAWFELTWMKHVTICYNQGMKLRLKFTQDHQSWTIEDWKSISWSDESHFQLWHSDGGVRVEYIQVLTKSVNVAYSESILLYPSSLGTINETASVLSEDKLVGAHYSPHTHTFFKADSKIFRPI